MTTRFLLNEGRWRYFEIGQEPTEWLAPRPPAEGWRPIESAPRDGRTITVRLTSTSPPMSSHWVAGENRWFNFFGDRPPVEWFSQAPVEPEQATPEPVPSGWQPIVTAPRDGTWISVRHGEGGLIHRTQWRVNENRWRGFDEGVEPVEWRRNHNETPADQATGATLVVTSGLSSEWQTSPAWQPISSAPADGSRFLAVTLAGRVFTCRFSREFGRFTRAAAFRTPTSDRTTGDVLPPHYWMPFPAVPNDCFPPPPPPVPRAVPPAPDPEPPGPVAGDRYLEAEDL